MQPFRRGDTIEFDLVFKNSDGTATNLTGSKLYLTCKLLVTDADPGICQITQVQGGASTSTPAGGTITITDPVNGYASVLIPPAVTSSFTAQTLVNFDIQVKDATGKIKTALVDAFTVVPDITSTTA